MNDLIRRHYRRFLRYGLVLNGDIKQFGLFVWPKQLDPRLKRVLDLDVFLLKYRVRNE